MRWLYDGRHTNHLWGGEPHVLYISCGTVSKGCRTTIVTLIFAGKLSRNSHAGECATTFSFAQNSPT